MAKRTTQTTSAVKRTRKTAPRSKTTRRTATKPAAAAKRIEPAAPVETATAVGPIEAAPHGPTAAQIAERAYFLSLERQGPGGPLDDWLQAERELRNGSAPA